MTQMRARPKHLFSWGFDLYLDGAFLVGFDTSWLREGGRFTYEGRECRLSREGLWSGDFLLTADEQVLARATKESAWVRRFIVRTGQRELMLTAASAFARSFRLVEGAALVGAIKPDHFFTRGCTLELPDYLPVPVRVFLFWLVVLMWRRADSAAAGAS
jgi:hypothetical protein